MAQFAGLFPRSYAEAEALLRDRGQTGPQASVPLCGGCRLHRLGEAVIAVESRGVDLLTWTATGRVKINTKAHNDSPTLARVNACLPPGYRAQKKGGAVHLDGPAGRVAVFLSSTIFRVGPDPDELESSPVACEDTPADTPKDAAA